MNYILRPYQKKASDAAVEHMTDPRMKGRPALIVAPTGSGKSLVIAELVDRLPGSTIVFQPSKEILLQNQAKLISYGRKPAIWSASLGRRQIGDVTLATIGSVVKHPDAFAMVRNVIIDECHLVNPKQGMYKTFLDAMGKARIVGLTATPYRLATNSFGSELRFLTRTRPRVFRDLVHYTQIPDLFRDGYLCPLRYKEIPLIDRRRLEVNSTGADFTDASAERAYREVGFAERIVAGVRRLLNAGRRFVVVFTRFTREADAIAAELGDLAATVTAKTSPVERRRILEDFKDGRLRVVTNVGVIALGFDFPELDTVVLGRLTLSLALFYQQVGRAIRMHIAKNDAVVIDMVGNIRQFGRVEDMVLRPGGKKGEKWAFWSNGRQLTNQFLEVQ